MLKNIYYKYNKYIDEYRFRLLYVDTNTSN